MITLVCAAAIELSLGIHVAHLKAEHLNDGFFNNRMVSVKVENVRATYFKNSYYNDSFSLTYNYNITERLSVDVGVVHGYKKGQIDKRLFLAGERLAVMGAVNYEWLRSGQFSGRTSLFGEVVITSIHYRF